MASVTLAQPIDMSRVYTYTLTYHNYRQTGSGSGWYYHGPVVFYTPGGTVDVGAILTIQIFPFPLQLLEIPSPITHINVYGSYGVDAPAIPSQPVYGPGWFGPQWIGEKVTINFASLLRGDDSITGSAGADTLLGFSGSDSISGLDGNDLIFGGSGNDLVNGGAGNDSLDGGVGSDTLSGGNGDDLLILNMVVDVVVENSGEGSDTVRLVYNVRVPTLIDLTSAYGGNVEHVQVIGSGAFNLTGNAASNSLTGNASNNILIGGAGNDWLDGRVGADTLIGGAGDDTYVIDNLGDRFTEQADEGTDTIQINRTVNLNLAPFVEVENVVLTGAAALNATGDNGNNQLIGNSASNVLTGDLGDDVLIGNEGNDRLDGGTGDDTLEGGAGSDIYMVDSVNDTVTESLTGVAGGTDLVHSAVTLTLGANVERLTLTGTDHINGIGNTLNNILAGNNGNNVLDGGVGADKMVGGLGNDTYVVDVATDVVTEAATPGAGVDTVWASITYRLGANLENLELMGGSDLKGTGNVLSNNLTGNSGNNVLSGLTGNDQLHGGLGNDTLDGGLGQDTVNGEAGDDQITMLVTAGNVDTIDAGADTDMLILSGVVGGNGLVVVNLLAADQVVFIAGDVTRDTQVQTGFEGVNGALLGSAMTVTGSAGDNLIIGSKGNDTITGGAGNDTLSGGRGMDNLQGGTGNDVMLLNSVAEFARGEVFDGGDGIDTLRYTGTTAATLILTNLVTNIEQVEIATATGNTSGRAAINVNAAAITSNGMTLAGNNGANILTGTAQADTLLGNAGNDQLNGGAGDDTLIGGTGADRLTGGGGIDLFVYNTISDSTPSAMDVIVGFTQGEDQIDLRPLGVDDLFFSGLTPTAHGVWYQQSGGNTFVLADVTGNTTPDIKVKIIGLMGLSDGDFLGAPLPLFTEAADTVDFNAVVAGTYGGNQYDALGGDDNVTLPNSESAALAAGFDPTQTFHGGAGNDTIMGGGLDDMIDGGMGSDQMTGGFGDDLFMVDNVGDVITEHPNEGTDIVQSSITLTLPDDVEQLTLVGSEAINGTGNGLNNTITGNAVGNTLSGGEGNDTLSGGAGDDSLDGGDGDDTYVIGQGLDMLTENLNEGTDTVQSSITHTLGANFENLTLTGVGAINGTGNDLANVLMGNSAANILNGGVGDDTLIGGAGIDTMLGGAGNDTYVIDVQYDVVIESPLEGIDTIQSSVSYLLSDSVENLILLGSATINGYGNSLDNVLTGTSGNNWLTDYEGDDLLDGGAGDDVLSGGAGNDMLDGGAGNDMLVGGAGIDTMSGGPGDDRYTLDDPLELGLVTEAAGAGSDTLRIQYVSASPATIDLTTPSLQNFENVEVWAAYSSMTLIGNAADNTLTGGNVLIGGSGDDRLIGGGGGDTLQGGAGNDLMVGSSSDDLFMVDDVGDVVIEYANEGTDSVQSSITFALPSIGVPGYVENLTLIGLEAINGAGNELNNTITGNDAGNTLSGGEGSDTLYGGAGDDTLDGGNGVDTMIGGVGNDTYVINVENDVVVENPLEGFDIIQSSFSYSLGSSVENLTLLGWWNINGTGNSLDNILIGNGAGNWLDGASGNDTLTGNAGDDGLLGGEGDDVMDGGGGNDTLGGWIGNDTFNGGPGYDWMYGDMGSDTYLFNRGDGEDTIIEMNYAAGDSDTLLYGMTINPLDLVISQQANDLRIAIHNSTDSVTIQNWYTNSDNQVETIQAGNGQQLLNTQVDQLIQAMAQFTTDTGLSWDAAAGGVGDPAQQAQFQGILAANWQS